MKRKIYLLIPFCLFLLLSNTVGFSARWLNGKLLYKSKGKICVIDQDGIHVIFKGGTRIGEASWSPDGENIVFNLTIGDQQPKLYIMSLNGETPKEIKIDDKDYKFRNFRSPRWSPGGDRIAFIGIFEGKRENVAGSLDAVFTVKTDGTELKEMGWDKDTWFMRSLCWAPDGRRIVFSRCPFGKQGQISLDLFIIDTITGEKKQLTQTKAVWEDHPSFSPNGKRIAYTTSSNKILIMDLESKAHTEIPLPSRLDVRYSRVTWSINGNQIIFDAEEGGDCNLYLYDLRSNELKRVIASHEIEMSPDWWGGYAAVRPLNLLNTLWSLIKRGEIK